MRAARGKMEAYSTLLSRPIFHSDCALGEYFGLSPRTLCWNPGGLGGRAAIIAFLFRSDSALSRMTLSVCHAVSLLGLQK